MCANFSHEWQNLQYNVDSKGQIFFEKSFMAIVKGPPTNPFFLCVSILYILKLFKGDSERQILFTLRAFAREKSPKKYFFKFRFYIQWRAEVSACSRH